MKKAAAALVFALTSLVCGALATPTSAGTTPLLPGETTTSQGVPSFDFGTNDGINYNTPTIDTLGSGPGTPAANVKAARLTLDRIWSYQGDTYAYVESKVSTAEAMGTTCMVMLGSTGSLAWMEKTIKWTDSYCHIYEFGNEPDNYGSVEQGKISVYTNRWNKYIPMLRTFDPAAIFGGPVLTWSGGADASKGTYPDDMAYFLAKTAASGVRADFIDYHDYTCQQGKTDTEAACLANTQGDFAWNYNNVTQYETQYYGGIIPTGISEYNFDSGDGLLYQWSSDGTFMSNWETTAVNAIVATGMSFAVQFESLDQGGPYDMFSDAAPYGPLPQFTALAAAVQQYGG